MLLHEDGHKAKKTLRAEMGSSDSSAQTGLWQCFKTVKPTSSRDISEERIMGIMNRFLVSLFLGDRNSTTPQMPYYH